MTTPARVTLTKPPTPTTRSIGSSSTSRTTTGASASTASRTWATTALLGILSRHPALKAVSPQAPVTDWFRGDDFHHNGALFLTDAFDFMSGFGVARPTPTNDRTHGLEHFKPDEYRFFLDSVGPLPMVDTRYFHHQVPVLRLRTRASDVRHVLESANADPAHPRYPGRCHGRWRLVRRGRPLGYASGLPRGRARQSSDAPSHGPLVPRRMVR